MEQQALKHPYPPAYKKGMHWAIDAAWEILDDLPVGMLPKDYRLLLAGKITGTLMRTEHQVVAWMGARGYATGHGDTIEDLLVELEGQAKRQTGHA
jgi:hypothetical protein